jgi:hypothetical protein
MPFWLLCIQSAQNSHISPKKFSHKKENRFFVFCAICHISVFLTKAYDQERTFVKDAQKEDVPRYVRHPKDYLRESTLIL